MTCYVGPLRSEAESFVRTLKSELEGVLLALRSESESFVPSLSTEIQLASRFLAVTQAAKV